MDAHNKKRNTEKKNFITVIYSCSSSTNTTKIEVQFLQHQHF
jgi:hypothetical protein